MNMNFNAAFPVSIQNKIYQLIYFFVIVMSAVSI